MVIADLAALRGQYLGRGSRDRVGQARAMRWDQQHPRYGHAALLQMTSPSEPASSCG